MLLDFVRRKAQLIKMEEMPIADRISAELEEKNRVLGEYVIDREMNNDLDAAI